MATVFRGPLQARYQGPEARSAVNAQPAVNLLVATLAVVATPFLSADFPNPVTPVSRVAAVNAQQLGTPFTVQTFVAGQSKNYDFPNPLRPISRAVASSSLGRNLPLALSATPAIPVDYTNPVRPVSRQVAVTSQPNGRAIIYAQPIPAFFIYDTKPPVWPVSRQVSVSAQAWVSQDLSLGNLVTPYTVPQRIVSSGKHAQTISAGGRADISAGSRTWTIGVKI
jgi:hypothetical protein